MPTSMMIPNRNVEGTGLSIHSAVFEHAATLRIPRLLLMGRVVAS